ncbi:MAG: GIY-YIG nuclease family protein [Bacteroidetes bacterium]|nr:GIY-YIG nuclease family protein [Bacteroidota bacterium]
MNFYVYIIQSERDGSFYKGFTENPNQRIEQHNQGECTYTSQKIPWKLVALLQFESKREALIKEKKLKKYSTESLIALIQSNQNILNSSVG